MEGNGRVDVSLTVWAVAAAARSARSQTATSTAAVTQQAGNEAGSPKLESDARRERGELNLSFFVDVNISNFKQKLAPGGLAVRPES